MPFLKRMTQEELIEYIRQKDERCMAEIEKKINSLTIEQQNEISSRLPLITKGSDITRWFVALNKELDRYAPGGV